MSDGPSAAVAAAIAQDRASAGLSQPDRLEAIRGRLREVRNRNFEIADHEATVKTLKEHQRRAIHEELPELMGEAHVDRLGLEAEGNLPAYDCVLSPYYNANIAADWEDAKRAEGFATVEAHGGGDIIKRTFTITFGRDEADAARQLRTLLDEHQISFNEQLAIPWQTLTAWLKEMDERKQPLPPLDKIGATVGRVVKLKPRKT